MKNYINILLGLILFAQFGFGQQVEKNENGTFALRNATIITVTNGTIQNGILVIQDGKILDVGTNVNVPRNAKVIDCTGLFVYPGMIDAGTRIGLSEIGSVSLTQDSDEIGDFTPHVLALTAVNPNSVLIPVTRVNGVTTALTVPSRGRFPGTAALIDLHGYTPQQMYAGFSILVMNFPSTGRRGRFDRRSDEDIKKDEEKSLKKLNDIWDKAVLYYKIDSTSQSKNESKQGYNPQMDALLPVLRGDSPLLIEVNSKSDILSALKWVEKKGIKAIFSGVAEGWRVAKEIAEANIPVITGPVLSYPRRSSDRYDMAYANAGKMQKAGIIVALRTNETANVRNLPFNAGFAAAYGMGKKEALKAVTINPAIIFGIDSNYGSLEKGKVANLFITDGDPFETKTNVKHLFIKGWKISLESRHTLLYDEFLNRAPGLK